MTYEEMTSLLKEKRIQISEESLRKLDEYLHLLI